MTDQPETLQEQLYCAARAQAVAQREVERLQRVKVSRTEQRAALRAAEDSLSDCTQTVLDIQKLIRREIAQRDPVE